MSQELNIIIFLYIYYFTLFITLIEAALLYLFIMETSVSFIATIINNCESKS